MLTLCIHSNFGQNFTLLCSRVASFAVNALRQLAAKLLVRAERAELTSFTYHDEALRPFVSVLKHCESAAVREQVVQSIAQTITAHPRGLGSGLSPALTFSYDMHDFLIIRMTFPARSTGYICHAKGMMVCKSVVVTNCHEGEARMILLELL